MFFHHIKIWGFCGVIMLPVICWLFAMNIVMELSAWPPLSHIWHAGEKTRAPIQYEDVVLPV